MSDGTPAVGRAARFLALTVAVACALALIGYFPTRRWGGEGAVVAMVAGCVISVLASLASAVPVALAGPGTPPPTRASLALAAIGIRLAVAFALGALATFGGWFATRPLLIWLAISYIALLIVDTKYALDALKPS